jgi:hypothetical protein
METTMEPTQEIKDLQEEARKEAESQGHQLLAKWTSDGFDPPTYLCGCVKCGVSVEIAVETLELKDQGIVKSCEAVPHSENYIKAWITGESYDLLMTRLSRAIKKTNALVLERFWDVDENIVDYDYNTKRWFSSDGRLAMQWWMRKDPDAPISDENPQTATGFVDIVTLVSDDEMQPVKYVGPTYREHQDQVPLEPDTQGLAYLDGDAVWRFRREKGNSAYIVPAETLEGLVVSPEQAAAIEAAAPVQIIPPPEPEPKPEPKPKAEPKAKAEAKPAKAKEAKETPPPKLNFMETWHSNHDAYPEHTAVYFKCKKWCAYNDDARVIGEIFEVEVTPSTAKANPGWPVARVAPKDDFKDVIQKASENGRSFILYPPVSKDVAQEPLIYTVIAPDKFENE